MCGIWASIGIRGADIALHEMAHRGPDAADSRLFELTGTIVELGHRRLAILDPTPRSNEPLGSRDGRYWITFNGEIYNYLELREELKEQGAVFRTGGDTEVLLQALVHWGEAAIPRLAGMFAFVFLDSRTGEILVARDPFGIKPLHYAYKGAGLAFSSEIPALIRALDLPRRANQMQLLDFLSSGITDLGEDTMIRDIQRFPAGCWARIKAQEPERLEPVCYRHRGDDSAGRCNMDGFDAAALALRDRLARSVALHARSNVPIGVALSGGIDSAAVLGFLRDHLGKDAEIQAIGYSAKGSAVDERDWIELAAKHAGAELTLVELSHDDLADDLWNLVRCQGEPFPTASIYAQYAVMRQAWRQGIKVMLSGQGADEVFAGYRPYLAVRLAEMIDKGNYLGALHFCSKIAKHPDRPLKRVLMQAAGAYLPDKLAMHLRKLVGEPPLPAWVNKRWLAQNDLSPRIISDRATARSLQDRLRESRMATVLPSLLRYEDRNSMAHSVESRVPFLTTSIVDKVSAFPSSYLIDRDGVSKAVLRKAVAGVVPEAILRRRDKIGFSAPLDISADLIGKRPLQRLKELQVTSMEPGLLDILPSGERWRILMLAAWMDLHDVVL